MELRDIRYFVVVAEYLNIGCAAEALALSATALSKSQRRLEQSVGAKLVKRSAKGMELAAVGMALRARIGPLQGMLGDIKHEATDRAQGLAGQIHVGTMVGAAENLVADACVALSKETTKIALRNSVREPDQRADALQKGDVDFCVGRGQASALDNFMWGDLYENPDVVFASADHRLARHKQMTLEDLAQECWA